MNDIYNMYGKSNEHSKKGKCLYIVSFCFIFYFPVTDDKK